MRLDNEKVFRIMAEKGLWLSDLQKFICTKSLYMHIYHGNDIKLTPKLAGQFSKALGVSVEEIIF